MTTSPVSNQVSESPKGSRNLFEDPSIAAAAANDPFARWMSRNWKGLAVVMVAVAVSMVGYNQFNTIALAKRAAATETLSDIQASYDTLIEKEDSLASLQEEEASSTDAKIKEEKRKKVEESQKELVILRDKIVLMTDSLTTPKPFDILGALYKGLILARQKDFDKAQALLAANPWEGVGKDDSGERFVAELATLGMARALLDSPKHVDFARGQLVALAERGNFVTVQAVNAVRVVAQTDAQIAQSNELSKAVVGKFPAQIRFMDGVYQGEM